MAEGLAAGLKAAEFCIPSGAGFEQDDFTRIVEHQQSGTRSQSRGVLIETTVSPLNRSRRGIDADEIFVGAMTVNVSSHENGRGQVDLEVRIEPGLPGPDFRSISLDNNPSQSGGVAGKQDAVAIEHRGEHIAVGSGLEGDPP